MAPQDDKEQLELKTVEITEEDAWKLVKLSSIELLSKEHEEKAN